MTNQNEKDGMWKPFHNKSLKILMCLFCLEATEKACDSSFRNGLEKVAAVWVISFNPLHAPFNMLKLKEMPLPWGRKWLSICAWNLKPKNSASPGIMNMWPHSSCQHSVDNYSQCPGHIGGVVFHQCRHTWEGIKSRMACFQCVTNKSRQVFANIKLNEINTFCN